MGVVYLTTAGTHVRRKGERLEVWQGEVKAGDLLLFDLERLVVVSSVQFSSQALFLLLDRGIDVSFITSQGRLRGSLVSNLSRNVYLRLAQFERWKTVDFPGRKKHPSTDPANALLSLGYVLLGNELGARLEARGLDPAVGFLHGLRYGRSSLALDLVEVFRQPVIDRLTLRLLNRRQLAPSDFEGGESGLRLGAESLKKYLSLYEAQLSLESEGAGTPPWREKLQGVVNATAEMVISGQPGPLYTWNG